jgi:hypothetical protein
VLVIAVGAEGRQGGEEGEGEAGGSSLHLHAEAAEVKAGFVFAELGLDLGAAGLAFFEDFEVGPHVLIAQDFGESGAIDGDEFAEGELASSLSVQLQAMMPEREGGWPSAGGRGAHMGRRGFSAEPSPVYLVTTSSRSQRLRGLTRGWAAAGMLGRRTKQRGELPGSCDVSSGNGSQDRVLDNRILKSKNRFKTVKPCGYGKSRRDVENCDGCRRSPRR